MTNHVCETCGKSYKTRSGLWKHQKKLGHGKFSEAATIPIEESPSPGEDSSAFSSPKPIEEDNSPTPGDTSSPGWMDWDFGAAEGSTDTIPTTFKSILTAPPSELKNMSKAQRAALEKQNLAILKMGLTTVDVLLSKYGQAVSLDKDFEVKHSEDDKNLVAGAQYRYLEEKGFFLTNYISSGMIAGALTLHYVGAPVIRIRRKAKRKLFKGRGLLGRLPLIGRLFRRKQIQNDIGQGPEEVLLNE